jgi:hypothetical protein
MCLPDDDFIRSKHVTEISFIKEVTTYHTNGLGARQEVLFLRLPPSKLSLFIILYLIMVVGNEQ